MNNIDRMVLPEPINLGREPNALQMALINATTWGVKNFIARNPDYAASYNRLLFSPNTLTALNYVRDFIQANPSVSPIVISDFDGVLKPFPLFSRINPEVKDAFRGLHNSGYPIFFTTNRDPNNKVLFKTGTIQRVLNEMGIEPNLNLFSGLDQQAHRHSILRNQRMAGGLANSLYVEVTKIINSGKEPLIFALMDIKAELGGFFSAWLGLQAPLLEDVLFRRPPFNDELNQIQKPQVMHLAIF